ncbi:polyhydroxyalkanoic acid system family protein [Moraxella nasicaprae]|uniref:Polyhydroxyalkanoic acid system family protein n=1 Tax=Moraxella nasicaprae TaxID=2904122 RepID=A0ABY6F524_9GAMM|nr:polyhydroxyalkanoic acid system family protein [Moraxella nasicaprae]UXZ05199.1 polyhydroxyalkanoic acid system family protein [Moraxella nasicaprae]
MSDILIEKQHQFDFLTARQYAKQWLAEAESQFGLTANYVEGVEQDTASISKAGVDAKATLTADKIVFEANLGFFAKPLKGAISAGINEGLQKYFS